MRLRRLSDARHSRLASLLHAARRLSPVFPSHAAFRASYLPHISVPNAVSCDLFAS